MKKIFIKPKKGLLVRDPLSMQPLDPGGEEKLLNRYWLRRLVAGDVKKARKPRKEVNR